MPQNALTLPGGGVFDAFSSARQNALLQQQAQMQAQDQQMAAQEQRGMANTQGKIEGALMSGDRDTARTLAQGSGNAEVMSQYQEAIAQMDTQQREEALGRARAFAGIGASLLQLPYEQRQSALQNPQVQQQLAAYGIDPSQLAGFDPTDANIQAVVGPAAEIGDLLTRTAPVTLGENETRVDPVTGEQTIGQAGQEARALEGRGIAVQEGGLGVDRGRLALDRERLGEDRRQFDVGQAAPQEDAGPNIGREEDIRTEAERAVSEFRDIEAAFTRVRAAASDPSAAGDLALIFNFMKMQDPGSTVREGEFATAQNAAGIPSRARAAYNNILRGERLTPEQRQDFLGTSQRLYEAQRGLAESRITQFQEMATSEGLRPEFAIPRFAEFEAQAQPTTQQEALPQVGAIVDGYRFMGGDPADQNNWRLARE